MYQSLKGYQKAGQEVGLHAMNTTRHWVENPESNADPVFRNLSYFRSTNIDNNISKLAAVKNLFSPYSYVLSRFISEEFSTELQESIKQFQPDVIQYETLSTAYYLPSMQELFPDIEMVYRMHNVEQKIWNDLAAHEKNPWRKWMLKKNAMKLEKNENEILAQTKKILSISQPDSDWVAERFPEIQQRVYPFAVETSQNEAKPVEEINFFHIGSMDWEPNIEAMHWWLDEIWPRFDRALDHPFFMAGRKMNSKEFSQYDLPGFYIIGEVPDVSKFLSDKSVLVVPLKSGSGMRVKILEAMQNKKFVISTKEGITGIDAVDGKDYLLAESADDFLSAMHRVLEEPQLYRDIIESASRLLREKYSLDEQIGLNLEFFSL